MKGIKECVNWMIENPNKQLKCKRELLTIKYHFNGQMFFIENDANEYILASDLRMLDKYEWEPVKEPVDFMTAINSGKKMYPVEYFDVGDNKRIESFWRSRDGYHDESAIVRWLSDSIKYENVKHYINGMWYMED